jgi:hypothetical protein
MNTLQLPLLRLASPIEIHTTTNKMPIPLGTDILRRTYILISENWLHPQTGLKTLIVNINQIILLIGLFEGGSFY